MDAQYADRLASEAESLIGRLNTARLAATEPEQIAKIRRVRSLAWRRWNRRVEKWLHSEAR